MGIQQENRQIRELQQENKGKINIWSYSGSSLRHSNQWCFPHWPSPEEFFIEEVFF